MADRAPADGGPFRILLAEDNPSHAELVKRSLEDHPLANNITHVSDGEQALDYLYQRGSFDAESAPRPDLVLLDLRLPRIDGLEVLETVKGDERLRRIPVVILTTSEASGDVSKAYQLHANSYLSKPVDFDQFTKLMEELGLYWLGCNHFPVAVS